MSRAKALPRHDRTVTGVSISTHTRNALDAISERTGEARGRIIDAAITHGLGCGCSICRVLHDFVRIGAP